MPSTPTLACIARQEQAAFQTALVNTQFTFTSTSLALAHHVQNLSQQTIEPTCFQIDHLNNLFAAFETDSTSTLPGICYLAHLFESGLPTLLRQPTRANLCYSRCINHNNCHLARYILASNLESGHGAEKDITEAIRLYEQIVQNNPIRLAKSRLARLLDYTERNPQRAAHIYHDVISENPTENDLNALADMYAHGRPNFPARPAQSARLYETSIDLFASTHAMSGLAYLLHHGAVDVRINLPRAVQLYEAAIALATDPDALNNLALVLAQGVGPDFPKDIKRAVALWEVAIAQGNRHAIWNLARILETGDDEIAPNRARAVFLYKQIVSDPRFSAARFNLAWLLSSSLPDVEQDTVYAAKLYVEIIDGDSDVNAMFNLACLLVEGRGEVSKDVTKAIQLYERAICEGNHVCSMHSLGVLLSSGQDDMPKNLIRGANLLGKAVDAGREEAIFDLALVLSGGSDEKPINIEEAMCRYEQAIRKMHHMGAMINVSEILREGKHGISMDRKRAKELCERAIVQGFNCDENALADLNIGVENFSIPIGGTVGDKARQHAIQQGWHLVAMINLGGMLLLDAETEDMTEAMKLFEAALKHPLFASLCHSQNLNFTDTFKILKDLTKRSDNAEAYVRCAARVYELLIEGSSNASAMYLLAELFRSGAPGIPQNMDRAVHLYKSAISNGEPNAMMALGELMCRGTENCLIDLVKSFDLFAQVLVVGASRHLETEAVVNLSVVGLKQHHSYH